jgi:hypothetical protein
MARRSGRADFPHPALRRASQTDPQVHPTAHLSSAHIALSATAEPFSGVARPCGQSPGCWSLPQRTRSQVPSLHRHYPASTVLRTCPPPLGGPACPSRASGWERHRPTAGASRVACRFSLHTCHRQYPGGTGRASSLVTRPAAAFPIGPAGRLPHCAFRGLLGVHSRYGLHAR